MLFPSLFFTWTPGCKSVSAVACMLLPLMYSLRMFYVRNCHYFSIIGSLIEVGNMQRSLGVKEKAGGVKKKKMLIQRKLTPPPAKTSATT